jgi:hypothetical protein
MIDISYLAPLKYYYVRITTSPFAFIVDAQAASSAFSVIPNRSKNKTLHRTTLYIYCIIVGTPHKIIWYDAH